MLVCVCMASTGIASAQGMIGSSVVGETHMYWIVSKITKPAERWGARHILVYTPPGYDDPANSSVHYPVVYLLHGAPGNPTNFVGYGQFDRLTDQLIQLDKISPVIWVAPDGNATDEKHGDSEWVNSYDGQDLFEDFVTYEVVAWTDQRFRTIPAAQARILGGVSEGGYGSVNIALHHPDVFGKVLAISGYYTNDGSGWARHCMGHDEAFIRSNSPLDYIDGTTSRASDLWNGMHFYLGAGDDETHYLQETRKMAAALVAHGVTQKTDFLPGKHSWVLWNRLYVNGMMALLPKNGDDHKSLKATGPMSVTSNEVKATLP
ncbi:MAG: alpha/beta hydrolase-fold protein [Capsulimonadaceae bacterium]|nr:alpha/beta hydrolase-fold protein [Capsulimonadaceae bacterium]